MTPAIARSCTLFTSALLIKLRGSSCVPTSQIYLSATWAFLLVLCIATPAAAQLSVGGVYGIAGGIAESVIPDYQDTKWHRSGTYGAAIEYRFKNGLSLGVRAERITALKLMEDDSELGSLEMSPMLATIGAQVLPSKNRGFGGYARFGAGIASAKFTTGPAIKYVDYTTGVKTECIVKRPILFDVGGGVDYFLFRQLSITGDFRLLLGNVGTKWRMSYGGQYVDVSDELGKKFYASTGQVSIGVRLWLRGRAPVQPASGKP
jgi:hypothetical protein